MRHPSRPQYGAVASPHPTATAAGVEMLRAGGNAIDAAIATAFALTVVTPASSGPAGYGGCMLVYLADRHDVVAIDFNGRAPMAAYPDMFTVTDTGPEHIRVANRENEHGGRAVDAPGNVAGLTLAQERFGALPLETVMQPAIRAARDGYTLDVWTVKNIQDTLIPNANRFKATYELFLVDGRLARPGDVIRNSDLAETLTAIARDGATAFYRGDIAQAIVDTVQADGGLLTLEDLAAYQPSVTAPLSVHYRDREVYTVPPAAGGLSLLQQLRVLEGFDVAGVGQGADLFHLLIEVCKVCWRERLTRFGDPNHIDLNPAGELGEQRISALQAEVAEGLRAPRPGRVIAPDPLFGTVHLCASDAQGNVVSLTHTHGGAFGALLLAPGTGLILSHGLSRFDPRPGWPNSIAPGKAPLNNMAPLIILNDGRPELAIGGAGGRTILSNVFQAVVRCLDLGETVEAALAAPRFHVETAEPVHIETGAEELAEALQGLGHRVTMRPPFGGLQAIQFGRRPGGVAAAADPRRHGSVEYIENV